MVADGNLKPPPSPGLEERQKRANDPSYSDAVALAAAVEALHGAYNSGDIAPERFIESINDMVKPMNDRVTDRRVFREHKEREAREAKEGKAHRR